MITSQYWGLTRASKTSWFSYRAQPWSLTWDNQRTNLASTRLKGFNPRQPDIYKIGYAGAVQCID